MAREPNVLVVYTHPTNDFSWFRHAMVFRDSYLAHAAGVPHTLLIAYKEREGAPDLFSAISARTAILGAVFPPQGFDIGTLQMVCAQMADAVDIVVLLGAYSRILARDWLRKFVDAMRDSHVGIAGATGSYEQGVAPNRYNPHVRTTGFAVRPSDLRRLGLLEPMAVTKEDCHLFEHGPRSLYGRLVEDGRVGVVVGGDGTYDERCWEESRTFRAANQENLLIADNRSDAYAFGTPALREHLHSITWSQRPAPDD